MGKSLKRKIAKTTLITGATGGLGTAFVKLCASRGDTLIVTSTSEQKLNKLLKMCKENYPNNKVVGVVCDLSKLEDRKNVFKKIASENLKVNRLINNAGLITEGDFSDYSEEEAQKVIKVNCEGTISLTKMAMEHNNDGLEILTVSSMAGSCPLPHMALYAASKSFLTSFMISLSQEVKDSGTVITTICPSGILTSEDMKNAIKSQGFWGKATSSSAENIAKIGLKSLEKKKVYVIPKGINKVLEFISKFSTKKMQAKMLGKRWRKSQIKRGMK